MNYPSTTLGVFMDLYEAEVERFTEYLRTLSPQDCKAQAEFAGRIVSVEGILAHVVHSGLGYAQDAHAALRVGRRQIESEGDWIDQIRSMVPAMATAVQGAWDKSEDELNETMIDTSWGQRFSLDQLMEHAIVHVLWHRRQCARVIEKARTSSR